jgi:pimeloyl-ACP methyl ester carboxylesterase
MREINDLHLTTRSPYQFHVGGTPALLFLSGGFGTVQNWSRVIRRLDGKYRTVRFDARARGKSGRSAEYPVQAAVDGLVLIDGAYPIDMFGEAGKQKVAPS